MGNLQFLLAILKRSAVKRSSQLQRNTNLLGFVLLITLLPHLGFTQEKAVPVPGQRVILKIDTIKGYQLIKIKNSQGDTLLVSEQVMDDIGRKIAPLVAGADRIGFQLVVDQDAFLKDPINEDRDYTMGMQLTIGGARKKTRFVRWLFDLDHDAQINANWTNTLSFSGFTPIRLERNYIDYTDRPYAALLSFSAAGIYSFKEDKSGFFTRRKFFRSTSLLGFMGRGTSRSAKFIQTAVHSGQRSVAADTSQVRPNPMGWEFAIANKSNFAVVANYNIDYGYEFEHSFVPESRFLAPLKMMIKPGIGIALGTLYDYATTGIQLQFGFFSKSAFSGNNDGSIFKSTAKPNKWEFSLTGEFFGQFWGHNATLSGILFNRNKDSYHLDYDQIEKWTHYYSYGGEVSYKRIVSLGYSKVVRSAVMKSVDREQAFGRVVLRVNM